MYTIVKLLDSEVQVEKDQNYSFSACSQNNAEEDARIDSIGFNKVLLVDKDSM